MKSNNQSTKHRCAIGSAGRRLATLLILLAASIGPPMLGSAAAQMIDLGTLGGTNSYAWAVSNGQVVGEADTADGATHAFSWTAAGGMVDLGTLPGYPMSEAMAVDNGLVAGDASNSPVTGTVSHAFAWTAASGIVDLGTLGGAQSIAYAVNKDQVVGRADTADGHTHAFLWTAASGMVDLGALPGYPDSYAFAVSNGQAAGFSTNNKIGYYHAFGWTAAGGMIDLGTLPGGSVSVAYAVNNGQIVGWADTPTSDMHAFSWTAAGGMVDLGGLPGYPYTEALSVNNGQVVGTANDGYNDFRAFSWTAAGGMVDLGTLGGAESQASSVSNGQVAGQAETGWFDVNGEVSHPFLWTAAGGMVDLGTLPGYPSGGWANEISNGQVVGVVQQSPDGNQHAYSWTAPSPTPTPTATAKPTPIPTSTPTPALSGTITLLPSMLNFGTVKAGQTSTPAGVTLSNGTGKKLNLRKTAIGQDFTMAGTTCSSSLSPGQSCSYSISFKPRKAGNKSETFKVTDNAVNSPQQVELQGSGTR